MEAKRAQAIGEAVVGYMRVSTARQGEEGISLELQQNAIYQFAESAGLPIIAVYSDVASGRGRRSIHRRAGLRKAFEACRAYEAHLVVWDLVTPFSGSVYRRRASESVASARKSAFDR